MTEFMRFTVEEVNAGRADGWVLAAGWFCTQGTAWAWFQKVRKDHGTTLQENPGTSPGAVSHG